MRKWLWLFLLAAMLVVGIGFHGWQQRQEFVQSNTPTLFFHGTPGSVHSEDHMVHAVERAGVTRTVVRAEVHANGKVALHGRLPRHPLNPLVEVNFDVSGPVSYSKMGQWAGRVVRALRRHWDFQTVNMVGHSMGNIAIVYYAINYARSKTMPPLVKVVNIAGHFDGFGDGKHFPPVGPMKKAVAPGIIHLLPNGRPDKMNGTYKQMLVLRHAYPADRTRVLNIYGDYQNASDGIVQNASSRSLRYLLNGRAKSSRELIIRGKGARHSQLHQNPQVDRALIRFLWRK